MSAVGIPIHTRLSDFVSRRRHARNAGRRDTQTGRVRLSCASTVESPVICPGYGGSCRARMRWSHCLLCGCLSDEARAVRRVIGIEEGRAVGDEGLPSCCASGLAFRWSRAASCILHMKCVVGVQRRVLSECLNNCIQDCTARRRRWDPCDRCGTRGHEADVCEGGMLSPYVHFFITLSAICHTYGVG